MFHERANKDVRSIRAYIYIWLHLSHVILPMHTDLTFLSDRVSWNYTITTLMIILPIPAASSLYTPSSSSSSRASLFSNELIRSHLLVLPRACTRILVPSFFSQRTIFPREGTGIKPSLRFISFSLLLEFRSIIQPEDKCKPNSKFCREKRMRFWTVFKIPITITEFTYFRPITKWKSWQVHLL